MVEFWRKILSDPEFYADSSYSLKCEDKIKFLLADIQGLKTFPLIISYEASRRYGKYKMGANQEKRTMGYDRRNRRYSAEGLGDPQFTGQGYSAASVTQETSRLRWPSLWHLSPLSVCLTWQCQSAPAQILICIWLVWAMCWWVFSLLSMLCCWISWGFSFLHFGLLQGLQIGHGRSTENRMAPASGIH